MQMTTQAVVTEQSEIKQSQKVEQIALFNADGTPWNAADATLTGLSLADSTDVEATDTVVEAIGKLQAQINALP